ncbi:REP-associated tyrosine transposase [Deferrisoma palaeochoriense]
MESLPHQWRLRKGRVSIPGQWYALTLCTADRARLFPGVGEDTRAARVVLGSIRWMHERGVWECLAYCLMPDHLHLVVTLGAELDLSTCVQRFKTFTSRHIRQLGVGGPGVWQRGFYDHALRKDESWEAVARYVLENPVRKGLVERPEAWPWAGLGPPPL